MASGIRSQQHIHIDIFKANKIMYETIDLLQFKLNKIDKIVSLKRRMTKLKKIYLKILQNKEG